MSIRGAGGGAWCFGGVAYALGAGRTRGVASLLPSGALRVGTARGRRVERATTAHFRVRPRGFGRLCRGPGGRRSVGGGRSAPPAGVEAPGAGWVAELGPRSVGCVPREARPLRCDGACANRGRLWRGLVLPARPQLAGSPCPVWSGWAQGREPFDLCSSEWSPRPADSPPILRLSGSLNPAVAGACAF